MTRAQHAWFTPVTARKPISNRRMTAFPSTGEKYMQRWNELKKVLAEKASHKSILFGWVSSPGAHRNYLLIASEVAYFSVCVRRETYDFCLINKRHSAALQQKGLNFRGGLAGKTCVTHNTWRRASRGWRGKGRALEVNHSLRFWTITNKRKKNPYFYKITFFFEPAMYVGLFF